MGFNVLATMVTTTTYGVWLQGDARGWVADGQVWPGDPTTWAQARERMRADAVWLTAAERDAAFMGLCRGANEFGYELLAVSIESWHLHALVVHGADPIKAVVGRLKNRMRQAVGEVTPGRGRIWAKGYDKRFCFTERDVAVRRAYIQRHAAWRPLRSP